MNHHGTQVRKGSGSGTELNLVTLDLQLALPATMRKPLGGANDSADLQVQKGEPVAHSPVLRLGLLVAAAAMVHKIP